MAHKSELLFGTADVCITDYRCDGSCGVHLSREEATDGHEIAITRKGAWLRRNANGRHLADATRVMLFNRGAPYMVEHPVAGGDHCTVIKYRDATIDSVAEELGMALGNGDAPFRAPWAAASAQLQLRAAQLHALAPNAAALGCEELCLQILANALVQMVPGRESRPRGRAALRHRDLACAAEVELARQFTTDLSLSDLAHKLSCSPFHLARVFKEMTGDTIHQRLLALRLGAALARLADTHDSIGTIAHESGFSDHSHLTALFMRRFRLTPSAFRRTRGCFSRSRSRDGCA